MKHSLYIKKLLFHSGLMCGVRSLLPSPGVRILRYHAIVSTADNYYASPSICLSPTIFEQQIRYLTQHYKIISLDTVADCIDTRAPFPAKSVVITFDDGYQDNFSAYQILKKYGATATFYIAAGCIDNATPLWLFEVIYLVNSTRAKAVTLHTAEQIHRLALNDNRLRQKAIRKITELIKSNNLDTRSTILKQLKDQTRDVRDLDEKCAQVMLSWDQVKEMADNHMTIAGHTMTHLNLPNAAPEDALHEIQSCKKLIEEKTGRPAIHFSYPNGGNYDYYNDNVKEMVKQSGYRTATTSKNGISVLSSDLFELERIRITPHLSEMIYQMDIEPLVKP
jgi:peptidoglycan/xylan/chitin deacetylase (PgdA/CDA1 family)